MSIWVPPTPDTDPLTYDWSGVAAHGGTPFSCTLITEIEPGLFLGGCIDGLRLPSQIRYVVSLYPWESYRGHDDVLAVLSIRLYDAEIDDSLLVETARLVNAFRAQGPTLVHCQAGLNRSSLVLALALMLDGYSADAAIAYLRARRSPAVLCNPHFEEWLLSAASEAIRPKPETTKEAAA